MRTASQHILFLATEYDAPGMHPYAINIINSLWTAGDHVIIVTRYGVEAGAFPGIPDDSITWIDYPAGKLQRALFRYFPKRLNQAIDRVLDTCGIGLIYSLTGELVLAPTIRRLQARVPVLYTVHDAVYHDYKFKSPIAWLKDRLIIALPQQRLFNHTLNKVTNSREQLDYITRHYPGHQVSYVPFPTLVNDAIAKGGQQVEELKGVEDGFILFFGTVQRYKGVHLLCEAYRSHPELHSRALVIAGKGDFYFDGETDGRDVIHINRFIDDSELRDLFSRAAVVVYPYTSATQSGVTSIAAYFGRPMVLSDLPFFTETCEGNEGVFFFPNGDVDALAAAIVEALESSASTTALYERNYSLEALRAALEEAVGRML
ncbi:MAG: glycosyltransferase family 4 protein [Muribaculaceae bacterium]|nr:glycosyltransferase family 4 protein [Muribaculaceae bacterium]